MAFYAFRKETNQEADQVSASENHGHVDHRHGQKLIRNGPGFLKWGAKFAERHDRCQHPCGETDGQEMKELIAYVGPGTVAGRILRGQPYLGEIDQQMNER